MTEPSSSSIPDRWRRSANFLCQAAPFGTECAPISHDEAKQILEANEPPPKELFVGARLYKCWSNRDHIYLDSVVVTEASPKGWYTNGTRGKHRGWVPKHEQRSWAWTERQAILHWAQRKRVAVYFARRRFEDAQYIRDLAESLGCYGPVTDERKAELASGLFWRDRSVKWSLSDADI